MFPTTGKRKAEESNPLLNAAAAKRAKKDVRPSLLFIDLIVDWKLVF
jgi:hypothetical protein